MKFWIVLSCLLYGTLMLSACDDKNKDFSGLSGLVAERNEVRQSISDETARKKVAEKKGVQVVPKEVVRKKTEEISSVVVYERDIEVLDSSSRMSLAKGTAYLNKEGQIVRIKIIRE